MILENVYYVLNQSYGNDLLCACVCVCVCVSNLHSASFSDQINKYGLHDESF